MSHDSVQLRSKVIERNASQFSDYKSLLIFGPPINDDLTFLCPKKVITFDYKVYLSHQASLEERVEFSIESNESAAYDSALVYLPKSKGELDLVLAYITPMLEKGADIYLVGEKKAGIASACKKLDKYGNDSGKIDSAKHCQLWQVTLEIEPLVFSLDEWLQTFPVSINDISLEVASIPGVFSFGELDAATDLLLNNMFTKLEGRILDFGCGSGVIGCYTKLLNPSIQLEMVDINILALECAKRTCELNSIEAKIYPSDGLAEVKGRVNGLVTNPPFHAGVSTEYMTTEGLIRLSKDKMVRHAPLLLVANNFLRYAHIIEGTFGRCDVLVENSKFRVYKAYR